MIKVTVELVSAVTGKTTLLGIAEICNDGTGTTAFGHYKAKFSKWAPKQTQVWRRGSVNNFPRRVKGAWDLLYLALRDAVGDRNK